jgi:hypothetical protein
MAKEPRELDLLETPRKVDSLPPRFTGVAGEDKQKTEAGLSAQYLAFLAFSNQRPKQEDQDNLAFHASILNQILNNPQGYARPPELQQQIDAAVARDRKALEQEQQTELVREVYLREKDPSYSQQRDNNIAGQMAGSAGGSNMTFRDFRMGSRSERQAVIASLIDDAAGNAGISQDLLQGVWFKETRFSSIREISITGAAGPMQFTRGTWADVIKRHGDEIAAGLMRAGPQYRDEAMAVLNYQRALLNGSIGTRDAGLQNMRHDPAISIFASAMYLRDCARDMRVDAMNFENAGIIYARYNIGAGAVRELMQMRDAGRMDAAKDDIGFVARVNPAFFAGNASAGTVLANYQATMENGSRQFDRNFGNSPQIAFSGPAPAVS